MSQKIKFCEKCGLEVQEYRAEQGFDQYTGEKRYSPVYRGCPEHIRGGPHGHHYTDEPYGLITSRRIPVVVLNRSTYRGI